MTVFVAMYHPALPGTPHVEVPERAHALYAARGWLDVDGTTPAPENIYLTPGVGDLRYPKLTDVDVRLTVAATVTADATLAVNKHTPVDAFATGRTVTLPGSAVAAGDRISVEKIDASANTVTVSGSIRGSAGTLVLVGQYETLDLIADGAGSWHPVSGHKTKAWLDSKYGAAAVAADPALRAALVLPKVGSYTYNADGTAATGPDGEVYAYNADQTLHSITLNGVTRVLSYNADTSIASVA